MTSRPRNSVTAPAADVHQALQRRLRLLRQPGFGCPARQRFQELFGSRRAEVFEHFHSTQRAQQIAGGNG
ncbi:MAG TPA: hypothetical protein VGY66_03170 [Gemmataceae bacterium]|jgi:hypothetical protein|nr:hypothetical protein [Gemmataceae bacterium]